MASEGDVLFRQGDRGRSAYLVIEGALDIVVAMQGVDVAVARVGRGGLVGEIVACSDAPRTATVVARGSVRLLRIEQEEVRSLLAGNPAVAASVIGQLGARLQRLNGIFAALTRAARALAKDAFEPGMLRAIRANADRYSLFADTFEAMAEEIQAKRAHAHEMQTAAEIQQSFLPKRLPCGPYADRFAIHAAMTPAAHVGGDFYEYFMVGVSTLCAVVGDVSGKGVPASMFMSMSRTVLKTNARDGGPLESIVARSNDLLVEDNGEGMFVTLAVARLDLLSGLCELVSGGHEEIYLLHQQGRLKQFGAMGPAIGLFEGAEFTCQTMRLAPGEGLVLATDGVTEAFNPDGTQFGESATQEVLRAAAQAAPDVLVSDIFKTSARGRDFELKI